jgi:hypothetical protein
MASTSQEETILRAIVISSSTTWSGQPIASSDRQAAFGVLADFGKYQGRIPICLQWLQQPQIVILLNNGGGGNNINNDATISAKLYACELLSDFLKHQYSRLEENDRLQLRHAALTAARMESSKTRTDSSILANKLASLLAGLMVRDFPQRWTTCIEDVFSLWGSDVSPQLGNKMCLEVLKLVAEDCTDSDFNAKVREKNWRIFFSKDLRTPYVQTHLLLVPL